MERDRVDALFMDETLAMAFDNMGVSSPNPSVGALITREDHEIARGVTEPVGGRHGEIVALNSARGNNLKGATMYVSLEPCSHDGKTPPCASSIIGSGISRVVIPLIDPNPLVAGKGVEMLKKAGVTVDIVDTFAQKAAALIRPFKKMILRHEPYVIHKVAQTLDGRTAAANGHSQWITGTVARNFVHRLRSRCDAVIIGKKTFENDMPRLNVRLSADQKSMNLCRYSFGHPDFFLERIVAPNFIHVREPLRVVVGLPDTIDCSTQFFETSNYIFYTIREKYHDWLNKVPYTAEDNLNIAVLDVPWHDLPGAVCHDLFERGIMTILLEGGATLASGFYRQQCVDQAVHIIAPRIAGSGLPVIAGPDIQTMDEALQLFDVSVMDLNGDILVNGYKNKYNFEMM